MALRCGLLPIAMVTLALHGSSQEVVDGSVAVVGERRFTTLDLQKEVDRLIPRAFYHSRLPGDMGLEFQQQAVEMLIERELVYQDAVERGMTASESEIRAGFARTLEKAGPQYREITSGQRAMLLAHYRPLVVRRLLIDRNEERFESALEPVSEEELRATYEDLGSTLLSPEEIRFSHLMIAVDPSASTVQDREAHELLASLRTRLLEGEEFADLAREHSTDIYATQGGDTGFVSRGAFRSRILEDVVFDLVDGETSDVITTIHGHHLVRRVETRERRKLTLEEAREGLILELAALARDRARAEWLDGIEQRVGVQVVHPDLVRRAADSESSSDRPAHASGAPP